MSKMGVPLTMSAPRTYSTGPSGSSSDTRSSSTADSPSPLGRKGERVANTPMRWLPPSRGGRTVGDQVCRRARWNCHISHTWENSSSPRTASGSRKAGSNTMRPGQSAMPLWRGTPNFSPKGVSMRAMGVMSAMVNTPGGPCRSGGR